MNLAILIGVTDYDAPVSKLPACKNDLALMSKLIRQTNKFGDILELGADTSSANVKTQLAQFITKHEGAVDELFFYYSGHGDLYKDDFYFLFSDFSDKRRNQTSLTTEELDSMLRTLSPKLTIKVVDACHAGVTYVKEPDALTKQLKISTGRFANCYFMFSSQSSQTSLQDEKLSDFTREFVEACTTFRGQDIRYRDIVDHISDAFATNSDQTPTFVIQAPCVEIFCAVDQSIRKLLGAANGRTSRQSTSDAPLGSAIAQAIKKRADEFCTKDQVTEFLTRLAAEIKSAEFSSDLKDSYRLVTETSDTYQGIPNLKPIGVWIRDNGADLFAKPIPTQEAIAGFDCTADTPYKSMKITAFPLFENLPHAVATIVFVFSKRDCTIFYAFQTVKEIDWGKLAPVEGRKWTYLTVIMRTDLDAKTTSSNLIKLFEKFLIKEIKESLGLVEDEPSVPKDEKTSDANKADAKHPANSGTKTATTKTEKQ